MPRDFDHEDSDRPRKSRRSRKREDDESGDEPRRGPKRGSKTALIVVLSVLGGVVLLGCLGIGGCFALMRLDSKVGENEVKTAAAVSEWPIGKPDYWQEIDGIACRVVGYGLVVGDSFEVRVEVKNTRAGTKAAFDPWSNPSSRAARSMRDDLGNTYNRFRWSIDKDVVSLRFGEPPVGDFVPFERLVDGAKELYVELDASAVQRRGSFRFRLTVAAMRGAK